MAKGNDRNDFNSLPERAGNARGAINKLTDAFEDLSKSGSVTHRSLSAMAAAMGQIPIPGIQIASVGVQIASAFVEMATTAERVQKVRIAAEFKRIEDAAREAAAELAEFQRVMLAGGTRMEALAEQEIKRLQEGYEVSAEAIREHIVALEEDSDAALQARTAFNKLAPEYERLSLKIVENDEKVFLEKQKLNKMLAETNEKVRILSGGLDKYEGPAKKATKATKDLNAEYQKMMENLEGIESQGPFTQEFVDQFNADWNRSTEAVYTFKMAVEETGAMIAYSFGELGAAAFDTYATAMDRVISGHNAFSASSGRKFQNATSEIMKSLGREAAARAVMHLAMAAAGTASPWAAATYGPPSENLKAAALFGSVAVIAGVGAGALSVKSAGAGGGSSRSNGSGGSSQGGPTYQVVIIGSPDYEGKQRVAQWIAEVAAGGG